MTFETEGSEYDSDVEEHQNKKKDNSLTCKIKINEEYAKLLKKPKPRGIVLPKYDLGYTCHIISHMEAIIDDSYKNYHLTSFITLSLFILLILRMAEFFQVFCHNIVIKVKFKRLNVIYWY
jgi:hypothetical protein